jgi:gamma-glutamylcyclotransferase (GGCT)/AIG2-like uncharacterized protein YtfP
MTRFFFYGTLMPSSGAPRGQYVLQSVHGQSAGRASLTGYDMFEVSGVFPAAVLGDGTVHGEVVEVPDWAAAEAIRICDRIECYRPHDQVHSMYVRRERELDDGTIAWVYLWNHGLDGLLPVPGGDWLTRFQAPQSVQQ